MGEQLHNSDLKEIDSELSGQQQRLERIESLVLNLHERLSELDLRRKQLSVFFWICSFHVLGTWLSLSLIDVFTMTYAGWYAGMLTTLGVWHGISLRPVADRWKRTILAVAIISCGAFVQEIIDFEVLLTIIGPSAFLLAGSAGIAAWTVRLGMHRGVATPDKPNIDASRLSAFSLFLLATWVAVAAAVMQFVDLFDSGEWEILIMYVGFALLVGAMFAWILLEAAELPHWWWYVRLAVFLPLTLFTLYVALNVALLDTGTPWIEKITSAIGLTCFHLISPVGTSIVFIKSGYRTVNAPARELESQSQDSSDQIWAKEPSSRAFQDESESAIRQQDEA